MTAETPSTQDTPEGANVRRCPSELCAETIGDVKYPGWDQDRCPECGGWYWRSLPLDAQPKETPHG